MSSAPARPIGAIAARGETLRRAVLDVRVESAFAAGHLEGSGHVPREEIAARRAELPSRDRALLVVADDPLEARFVAEDLASRGFTDVGWLESPLVDLPGGHAARGAPARLWRPAPFLEEVLPRLAPGRALDLAAGGGRDAVWLALHGFEVDAWDRSGEALRRASDLARRSGVTIRTEARDLESEGFTLPAARWDLVVCFRYLHRPLFPAIERALAPGGWLVYETFRLGQERFGKPVRPQFLLREGELASAFPSLSVVRYEELEPAGGPVTARLLARRPAREGTPA